MILNLTWKHIKGKFQFFARLRAAYRCFKYPYFICMYWDETQDKRYSSYKMSWKGCTPQQARIRCGVHAVEIFSQMIDEDVALETTNSILNGK